MEIVGVSKDARYGDLKREIPPVVYIPYDQGYPQPDEMTYVLRTTGDPLAYVSSVREIVHQADGRIAVSEVRTQAGEINDHMHQEIMLADLCSAFAMLALTIACVGLYGTMSYTVTRRTGEMGIRMALGAQRGAVVRAVLGEAFVLVTVGLAISLPGGIGHVSVHRIFSFRNEAQRSSGADPGSSDSAGCRPSGRVRARAAGLTNRPGDCAQARVTRVDFSVGIAMRVTNSSCLVAICSQHRAWPSRAEGGQSEPIQFLLEQGSVQTTERYLWLQAANSIVRHRPSMIALASSGMCLKLGARVQEGLPRAVQDPGPSRRKSALEESFRWSLGEE